MSTGNISDAALTYFEHKRIKALLDEALHDLLVAMPEDPLAFLEASFQKKTPLRLMIAGLPGCGKGIQGQMLAEKYGVVHISAGDMLRDVGNNSVSETASKIASFISKGMLVPDDLFVGMIIEEVKRAERNNSGWILDGFPRTRAQAIYLQTSGISPQKFFFVDVPEDVAARRTIKRYTDILSQQSSATNVSLPVSASGARHDDTPEAVATRLQYFLARKDELFQCYSPFYVRIEGDQSIEGVHNEICSVIDALDLPE